MERKIEHSFMALMEKNTEKGGAWRARVTIFQGENEIHNYITAWTTASAAKRWVKSLLPLTTKKSIKFVATNEVDEKGKPICFGGGFKYNVVVE